MTNFVFGHGLGSAVTGAACCLASVSALAISAAEAAEGGSALSHEPIPMLTDEQMPTRVPPLIELGPDFLGTGNLPEPITLPTGAVWTPAFWVFGNLRAGLQYYDPGDADASREAVVGLEIFGNLNLTPTERVLVGFSPLRENANFTGCFYDRDINDDWDCEAHIDLEPTTLFAEGEFGEIFPLLDPEDTGHFDFGFAVGRQPIFFQEGMMVNDTIDGIGITRDTIQFTDVVDIRATAFFGWGEVNRDDNERDHDAKLYGFFTETDLRTSTVNFDVAYVDAPYEGGLGGDSLNIGLSAIQRIGEFNTAFRVNQSWALDEENAQASTGTLFFAEVSTTPKGTHDVLYVNGFIGIDQFSSASRGDLTGGPLGRVGILYDAVGLGSYGSALPNTADEAYGAAIGYQAFFNNERTQLIVEAAARGDLGDGDTAGAAVGARFQQAVGNRTVVQVDGFVASREDQDLSIGSRVELLVRF